MANYKGSLELNWINKDKSLLYEIDEEEGVGIKPLWVEKDDIRVSEPRILKLKGEYGDLNSENMLIKGDNLLALRTLVEEFKNRDEKDKVKCIYIDPPFNTGSAFEHYADNLEHSQWLTMMRDRLILLKLLLRDDGLIFIHIDDSECHYLKILMDEIFGRGNFITDIAISTSTPSGVKTAHKEKTILKEKEHILVFRKTDKARFNPQFKQRRHWDTHYNIYFDKERLKIKRLEDVLKKIGLLPQNKSLRDLDIESDGVKNFYLKNVDKICQTQSFRNDRIKKLIEKHNGEIFTYLEDAENPRYFYGRRELISLKSSIHSILTYKNRVWKKERRIGTLLCDFWDDINFTNTQSEGVVSFPASKKPEFLLHRILDMSSNEEDVVLDSFAGSGTTGAVAHKMKRRWILVEMGNHAKTHCIIRLNAVINGKDQDKRKYNGGFRYYEVGESVIKDLDMNWDLTLEEMSRAVFMNFDYSFIGGDIYRLESCEDDFFLGRQKGGIAVCLVTKGTHIIRRQELNKLIKDLNKRYGNQKITIFTNMGVAVKRDELGEQLDVKKIPESILKKYRMV